MFDELDALLKQSKLRKLAENEETLKLSSWFPCQEHININPTPFETSISARSNIQMIRRAEHFSFAKITR